MRGAKPEEQMNMIRDPADLHGHAAERLHAAAKIPVQIIPPARLNPGVAILRAEHNVIVKTEVRRWHRSPGTPPGCNSSFATGPVAARLRRLPPANLRHASGVQRGRLENAATQYFFSASQDDTISRTSSARRRTTSSP